MRHINFGFIILAAAISLSACAIIPEARRASEGSAVTLSSIKMAKGADGASPTLTTARKAVVNVLSEKGIDLSSKSLLEMDVSLSSRPPTMGLFVKTGAPSVAGEGRSTRLDLCKDETIRLTVSLVNVETGQQLYRAHAEDQTCRTLSDSLIKSLAQEAIAGLKFSY